MFSKGRFSVTNFLKTESAGGMLLMAAAVLAMIVANTSLFHYYEAFIDLHFKIQLGDLIKLDKPMHLWINDGLMAFFFLLVGLELKREMIEGELSNKDNVILPAIGAVGGMAFPALIYVGFNLSNPEALRGWAIPSATDIAFALGVLSLLGPRVPMSLKLFLTSLAIFDDIGAIIIIAIFYTSQLSMFALGVAALCVIVLAVMNYLHVESKPWYFLVGAIMWVAILKSGVHATLAGVLLAMFIPMYTKDGASDVSPLKSLEHSLHGFIAFFILPVFAFTNSGISFSGMTMETLLHPVPVGIGVGLFIGNQFGIFAICWVAIKLGLTRLPDGMNWKSLYGTSILCGIGFTMSLFISSLAFLDAGNLDFDPRVGIMLGSLLSGLLGYFILRAVLPKKEEPVL